jgi:GcrA cell cycle regulator
MSWTDQQLERLRVLAAEGQSSAAIAVMLNAEFGTTFSRNAVIGKRTRHGVPRTRRQGAHAMPRVRTSRITSPSRSKYGAALLSGPPSAVRTTPLPDPEPASDTSCSLFELTAARCRWPIDDWGKMYCGATRAHASSYCAHHAHKARRLRV